MAISKVIYGDDTLIDITDSTIESSNMLNGTVGYTSAGVRTVGSVTVPTVNDNTITIKENGSTVDSFTLNQSSDKAIDIPVNQSYYGTCTDNGDVVAKSVTISNQNFKLAIGAMISVKFSKANSASNVTLNVNGTGNKSIYYHTDVYAGASVTVCGNENNVCTYIYDGTYWVWLSHSADSNTTYSTMSTSELTTGTATSARSVRADYLKSGINSLIDTKIQALDVTGDSNIDATKTIKSWSETDGKVSVTTQDIQIAESQVTNLTTDLSNKVNTSDVIDIEHGGTGATTRLNAVKALTNENVTTPTYVYGMTNSWGKAGYTSIANLKTTLGLKSAAYTESTAYAVANKQLTNEDLDAVTDTGFYYAAGGNTCSNKPTDVNNFGLEVIRDASGSYYTQIIYKVDSTTTITSYRRYCKNGTWSSWAEDKFTDTTYTFAEGSTNGKFTVTPSGGSAQSVTVHGLGSAAYTESSVYATSTHAHGNITKDGTITSDTTQASGDKLVIIDADNNKVARSKIALSATVSSQSQTTKFLREDGTFSAPTYTSIPSNNITGSGTSGYLVKFNGANTITNGPQLGSDTTFLKNDGTWDTPNQLKVSTTNPSSGSWYYPTWTNGGGGTARTFNINNGFRYLTLEGAAEKTDPETQVVTPAVQGRSVLQLGNGTKAGVDGNKRGEIFLYGEQNGYAVLYMTASSATKREIYFPDKGGTIALTSDIPTIPGVVSTTADGLAPMVTSTTAYLRGDGTWATPSNNYDRNRYTGTITAGAAIAQKNIIVARASDGKYVHLKTNKVAFDIRYPILYANADITSGSTGNNNYDVLNIAIATTQSLTLTAYKPVYIKGTLNGYTFTTLGTAPLTQTVPSSNENYVYMLLGIASSTANVYLSLDHRIFVYNEGFRELDNLMNGGSITGSLNVSSQISTQDIYITSPGSINFMGDATHTVLTCNPGSNTVTLPSGSGTLALVGDIPSLDWQGGVTISNSSTLTNISSYINGGYHDLYFVGCLDSTNAIYLNLMIPVADIKSIQSTTSKPRTFRSGYQQSSGVGGEFDIYAVVSSTQGSSVTYDIRVRGSMRKDGTAVSSPSITMYYR